MKWRKKAVLQNALSMLPAVLSNQAYYLMQRRFGGLRKVDPLKGLNKGIAVGKAMLAQGQTPSGKTFFEVGTGRVPFAPIAYWLMGAEKIVSVDLNRYMRPTLVLEAVKAIAENRQAILDIFEESVDSQRLELLLKHPSNGPQDAWSLMALCNIEYLAPSDAAETYLTEASVDVHTSFTVLEHIPEATIIDIFSEGARIVKDDGLFIHRIDYSDHFSHSDKSISAINFLKYSDEEWRRLAGNRYMYMNRLRHDDFTELYSLLGHELLEVRPDLSPELSKILSSRTFALDDRFKAKEMDVLCTTGSWFVSQKSKKI